MKKKRKINIIALLKTIWYTILFVKQNFDLLKKYKNIKKHPKTKSLDKLYRQALLLETQEFIKKKRKGA